jgi:hypothetical protein
MRSRVTVGIVCTVLGASIVGGIAWAAIPGSGSGVITACYPTSGTTKGQLRVIDYQAGARCTASERILTWQSRGMRFMGEWSSTTSYGRDNVVTHESSAYVAILSNTNRMPSDITYWRALFSPPPVPQRCDGVPWGSTSYTVPGSTRTNGCDLRGWYIANRLLQGDLTNADFRGATICSAASVCSYLGQLGLNGTNFSGSYLEGADFTISELVGANFSGAFLRNARFGAAQVSEALFVGADLTGATLVGSSGFSTSDLTGVRWSNTTCPDGSNSDNNGNTCVGHLVWVGA